MASKNTEKIITVIALGAAGCFLAYCIYRTIKRTLYQNYIHLGSSFHPSNLGGPTELSHECLGHPGYRMCVMTDGRPGVCGTSGMCIPDLMMDDRADLSASNLDDMKYPNCVEPISKEECSRFCSCKIVKGEVLDHEFEGCQEACRSNFYPA